MSAHLFIEGFGNEVEYVTSTVDNRNYLVRNMEDKKMAADELAQIRQDLIKVVQHLHQKYPKDDRCQRVAFKFKPNNLSEGADNTKYTSYSVNKGERVIFCLRQRDEDQKLVDHNTMLFVALHELAHIMTKSIGHTPEFWENFKFILEESIKIGVYRHQKFHIKPEKYCGTMISDTPLKESV